MIIPILLLILMGCEKIPFQYFRFKEPAGIPFHLPRSFNQANIVVDGNSISTGTFGTQYLSQIVSVEGFYNYSPTSANMSYGGKTTQDMIDEAPVSVDTLLVPGKRNVLIAWEVTNEVGSVGVEQAIENLKIYCNARRTAGWSVITMTCLPRINVGEEYLVPANELLLETWFTFADGVVDLRLDDRLATLNPTYYVDSIHTNTAGNKLIGNHLIKKMADMYGLDIP